MVKAQGGDVAALDTLGRSTGMAPVIVDFKSDRGGTLTAFDAGVIGQVVLNLGAGRRIAADAVDHRVGLDEIVKTGSQVLSGTVLCRIHATSAESAAEAALHLKEALNFS
jgi:thymidine phosphorylase